jgi:tripartite-type tricarboxylate transporter receptor subunit TctC
MTPRNMFRALATAAVLFAAGAAQADWAPKGTLTLQIGFGAGGSTDTLGRIIVDKMKEQTGWNIIAENKPGGGGVAMFTAIANRPADGSVIGLGVNMPILVNLVNRPDQLGFDLDSFDYLGTAARAELALATRADAPFDDVQGLVEFARANGGAAVAFDAKPQELSLRFVAKQAGVEFQFLSTKAGAEITQLVLGGQAHAGFFAGEHLPFLESGELKMLASMNKTRHGYAPDTPTLPEQGFDIYVDPFYFFAAAKGTPEDARAALVKAIDDALNDDEVQRLVQNALKSPTYNAGPEGTRAMFDEGLANVAQLFAP